MKHMKDNPLILQPVIQEYDTWEQEIIGITSQVQALITQGITPYTIAVIYNEDKYAEHLAEHFASKNLPVYFRRSVNMLEIPIIKKVIRIVQYLGKEHDTPYSGDHLLFEILHFGFFEIPPMEIARITVEVNDQKRQGLLTSIRKFMFDKLNTPAKTLFDIPLHVSLANASHTLEKLIGETANGNIQALLDKVIRDAGVFSYILRSNSNSWLLIVLRSLLDFAKNETLRKPGLLLQDFLDTIEGMQQNRIPLPLPVVTGTEQCVHLLKAEDCKEREFEYVFPEGSNASAREKTKNVSLNYMSEMLRFREEAPRIEDTKEEFIKRIVDNFVLSVTALNNYLRCPLEFYFKNIIRSPAGKSEAAEFGSAIHFAIQRLFEKMKADPHEQFPSIQEVIADFTWYMNSTQGYFTQDGFRRRLEYGKEVLANYYNKYMKTWPRIVAVELNIRNVVLRGVPLKGKVDKLEFNGKDVNVVDYKSGNLEKARIMLNPPSDQRPNGGDYWRQAVFYKILVDQYGGKGWKATGSEIDFVEPGKNGLYEKCKITIKPEDIETVSQQIVQVWDRIQQHDFYSGCGREGCYWCTLVR